MSVVEKAIQKLRTEKRPIGAPGETSAAPSTEAAPVRPEAATPRGGGSRAPASGIILDRIALRATGLLPPDEESGVLAREYRKIKRPLVARAIGRGVPRAANGHLIMIASAVPGEGKTFTALNLALSLAIEKDVRVLLVDADVVKPQLSREFGLQGAPGLLDVLRDPSIDPASLVHPTDVPTLAFMPAGSGTEEATEFLSSARMQEIAAALGEGDGARIVVLDSPPLLHTTESIALSHVVGQIVVVVRAESTPQPVLLDALKALGNHPAISLVLNQSRSGGTSGYYYGYGVEGADSTAVPTQQ